MDVTEDREAVLADSEAANVTTADVENRVGGEEAPFGEGLGLPAEAAEELKRRWGKDRDISLAELEGLPVSEQFLRIWATPERGEILWNFWYRAQPEGSRGFLDMMAESVVSENGCTIEEARVRLAVEKFLSDRGNNLAAKYVEAYKSRKLRNSRPLKPLQLPKKRKR